jgi:hypothetical protein
VCAPKLVTLKYYCDNCGRLSDSSDMLCIPMPIPASSAGKSTKKKAKKKVKKAKKKTAKARK